VSYYRSMDVGYSGQKRKRTYGYICMAKAISARQTGETFGHSSLLCRLLVPAFGIPVAVVAQFIGQPGPDEIGATTIIIREARQTSDPGPW